MFELFYTCDFDFSPTKFLILTVESYGDMKTLRKVRVIGNFFVHWNLSSCKCCPGPHRLFRGVKNCLILGKTWRSDRKFWISVEGVPRVWNSSLVRESFNSLLPFWMSSVSCIWKPSQIWPNMSMPKVVWRFDLVDVGVFLLGIVGVDVAV